MKSRRRRIQIEDTLKYLHECEYEGAGRPGTAESVAGALSCSRDHAVQLLTSLRQTGWIERNGEEVTLTERGREEARQVIRIHRLLETYLASQSSVPSTDWHRQADRMEHRIRPGEVEDLAKALGHPRFDPHGDPIPTSKGILPPREGVDLSTCAAGSVVFILHVADEPDQIGRSLVAKGLAPGQTLRILKRGEDLNVEIEGREVVLSPEEASEVWVCSRPDLKVRSEQPLSELVEGQGGRVNGLSPACRGAQRNRLLDLGFVRGSRVEVERTSPMGRPTAYRIRGTLIALRPSQAVWILLDRESVK